MMVPYTLAYGHATGPQKGMPQQSKADTLPADNKAPRKPTELLHKAAKESSSPQDLGKSTQNAATEIEKALMKLASAAKADETPTSKQAAATSIMLFTSAHKVYAAAARGGPPLCITGLQHPGPDAQSSVCWRRKSTIERAHRVRLHMHVARPRKFFLGCLLTVFRPCKTQAAISMEEVCLFSFACVTSCWKY